MNNNHQTGSISTSYSRPERVSVIIIRHKTADTQNLNNNNIY